MRTMIQTLSDIELKVEVEIPAATVDAEFGKQIKEMQRLSRVKGFRKGKAPVAMVKRMYAEHLATETARAVISASAADALKVVTRPILGEPSFDKPVAKEGHPLTYSVHLQVKPEIKLTSWEGIEVNVPAAVVEDETVEGEITRQREGHRERVPVEQRGADTGDLLVIDCTGKLDGAEDPRLSVQQMDVRLGDSQFIPGFADELVGMKAEETRTFEITFPDDYGAEEMAGRPAEFTVTATGHFMEELPALDDDFAQDCGHDSLDEMRASIRGRLTEQAETSRDREIADRLMAVVLERNPFMVPPDLVHAQADHRARRLVHLMRMQGMPESQAIELVRSNYPSFVGEAETEVRRYLALEALAADQGIEIGDEAVDADIAERKEKLGERAAAQLDSEDARHSIRAELSEKAALDLIKQRAKITDHPEAAPDDAAGADGEQEPAADAE